MDNLRFFALLILVFLLLQACFFAPFLVAKNFGVWWGLLASIGVLLIWAYEVRPFPGFLAGIISLSGLSILLGQTIISSIGVIRLIFTW